MFIDYYTHLFTSQVPIEVDRCLENVECRVSADMNTRLVRSFVEAEVELVLSQIQALKSPSPDSFSAGFYHNSWGIVGKDVSRAVLGVLNGGLFDRSINATNICLIPKVPSPSKVTDYRPISLCNVHYKLI